MCLPTVSVVVLGAAGAAPLVSTVAGVDLGVWWTRHGPWPCWVPGRLYYCSVGVSLFMWPKKMYAALDGGMAKSIYFASRSVEFVDQPPA